MCQFQISLLSVFLVLMDSTAVPSLLSTACQAGLLNGDYAFITVDLHLNIAALAQSRPDKPLCKPIDSSSLFEGILTICISSLITSKPSRTQNTGLRGYMSFAQQNLADNGPSTSSVWFSQTFTVKA